MGTVSDFDLDPSQRPGGIENRGDTIGGRARHLLLGGAAASLAVFVALSEAYEASRIDQSPISDQPDTPPPLA